MSHTPQLGSDPTKNYRVAAVDFETTYDKRVSIKPLGWDAYFRHEDFECYLVAIKTNDDFEWVGHPKDAPWDRIKDHLWISHNASFDESLYYVAKDLGWWGDIPLPKIWHCTSDMVAYLGYPRSLKGAAMDILNVELSKEVRTNMSGKRPPNSWTCVNKASLPNWEEMKPDFWQDVLDYALDDSVWCLALWDKCASKWPEQERWLSDHTRAMGRRGVPVDIDLVVKSAAHLRGVIFDFEAQIPWRDTDALLSRAAFDRECIKYKLSPPKSLAKESAEADQWLEEHEPDHPWIFAYRNWRRANSLLKKVEAVERASRDVGGHYRYFGGLMYCGAHTKRWSGSGGNLNLQNPPKEEMFGVKFRDFFRAQPKHKLAALDLSQIEVRTLTWLSRDFPMLRRIAESPDIYQAFGEGFKLWTPEQGSMKAVDNALRQFIKPIVLGSGFGASAWAFADKERAMLQKAVAERHKDYAKEGRAVLETLLKDKDLGVWWWKKAGRLIRKGTKMDVVNKTSSGKEYTTLTPQWKVFAQRMDAMEGKFERGAALPINLDEWDWDWENVLIYSVAAYCVTLYRTQMTAVTTFWDKMSRTMKASVMDRTMEFTLPSGNTMTYKNVRRVKDDEEKGSQILCTIVRNGRKSTMKPWYGLLTENLAQSLARDVFGNCIRKLEEAGFKVLFHVHDEVVVELPEEGAEAEVRRAEEIMRIPPDWIKSLPVDAEGNIGDTYATCK